MVGEGGVMKIHFSDDKNYMMPLCWEGQHKDLAVMATGDVDRVTCLDCLRKLAKKD